MTETTFLTDGLIDIEFDETAILIWSDGSKWWFDEWIRYDCDCEYCEGEAWELLRWDDE